MGNKVRDFASGEEIIKRFNQISDTDLSVADISWLIRNINDTIRGTYERRNYRTSTEEIGRDVPR